MKITLTTIFILCLFSCKPETDHVETDLPFPQLWSTYRTFKDFDTDFQDLKSKGIGMVSVNEASAEALDAARKHGMKIIMKIDDITEQAYKIDSAKVERAIMLAGAYQGKAIDRFRFAFEAKPQEILIENPVYDSVNCYGDGLGHYFPGMKDPIRAEAIVKQADFDGEPHLLTIPATTSRADEHHWKMKFDLSNVQGDLDNVLLAVYWLSEGSREYWMFGDSASPFAASTKDAVAAETRKVADSWAEANGGEFPADVVLVARYGDECWNLSGHLNCSACSYPIWDYSEAAIKAYQQKFPGQDYPRGKSWPDMFGRQAYANWLYNYHEATASLAGVVKSTLQEMGLNLPIYRNFTRAQVFDVQNDHDGTGLELLTKEFDITLIDPYPVGPEGYRASLIPVDMNYMAGLSRRYKTYLVPWMQAHHYLPDQGYLVHPEPADIEKIINQHRDFNPVAAMWLGYGPGEFYTFPSVRPESWQKAGEVQSKLFEREESMAVSFAAIRPYNVRALRDTDRRQKQDIIFGDFLSYVSTDTLLYYDPFEPLNLAGIDTEELQKYPVIFAAAGNLSSEELHKLAELNKTIFYIQEADQFLADSTITGIAGFKQRNAEPGKFESGSLQGDLNTYDQVELTSRAEVIAKAGNDPVIWKVGGNYFITGVPGEDSKPFYQAWISLMP